MYNCTFYRTNLKNNSRDKHYFETSFYIISEEKEIPRKTTPSNIEESALDDNSCESTSSSLPNSDESYREGLKKGPQEKSVRASKVNLKTAKKWSLELKIDWLEFTVDDADQTLVSTMHCSVCKNYASDKMGNFVQGTSNIKQESVRYHFKSESRRKAIETKTVKERAAKNVLNPIEEGMMKMEKSVFERMEKLFRTAFFVAIKERPFTDFPSLLELQEANGVNLGETYCNSKSCKLFIDQIAGEKQDNLKDLLNHSDYFSVMSDSSTDRSVSEKEIVYVRLIKDGYPTMK